MGRQTMRTTRITAPSTVFSQPDSSVKGPSHAEQLPVDESHSLQWSLIAHAVQTTSKVMGWKRKRCVGEYKKNLRWQELPSPSLQVLLGHLSQISLRTMKPPRHFVQLPLSWSQVAQRTDPRQQESPRRLGLYPDSHVTQVLPFLSAQWGMTLSFT